jgi:hypothetical protein
MTCSDPAESRGVPRGAWSAAGNVPRPGYLARLALRQRLRACAVAAPPELPAEMISSSGHDGGPLMIIG